MRTPMIAANWKMHMTNEEAIKFVDELKPIIKDVSDVQVLICPPSTAIEAVGKHMEPGGNLWLGSQNIYYEEQGAFTGEICADMLLPLGCCFALVGHSERRGVFNESNELINKKLKACLKNNITPVLCIGEEMDVRNAGEQESFVSKQLEECLAGVEDINKIIVAYEPIWAISKDDPNHKAATADDAQAMHAFIRKKLVDMYGDASEVRLLYGGSMKPENVKELMAQEDIDGGLVGGASLKVDSFSKLIKFNI